MSFPKYKYLITYRLSEIIFDLVDQFILSHLSQLGDLSYLSLKDQILKATRSIKQNIIEAVSEVASLKSQIKLLGVAYGSVEELIADFEDFLRRKNLEIYPQNHPKIITFRRLGKNLSHLSNLSPLGELIKKPTLPASSQDATNLILTLCHQLSFLLHRQIKSMEAKFIEEGGYTENLFLKRLNKLKSPKSPKGFTLMELLIIIALIAILATALLILFNPKRQIEKAWDTKRKNDLNTLRKVLEDYYNDKGCYPTGNIICYNTPKENRKGFGSGATLVGYSCNICGTKPTSPDFSPYLSVLPCDPQHPIKDYLYQYDPSSCPQWFRIYSMFSIRDDSDSKFLGCPYGGCGLAYPPAPTPPYGYDYGVSNTVLESSNVYNCLDKTNVCNVCNTYDQCLADPGCPDKNKIYGSRGWCCATNPGACR
jgi:four helix bundle suffix protein